jgi:hypothetical protein
MKLQFTNKCIGAVMVSVLTSYGVVLGFKPRLGQIKHYEIGICCFSNKHTSLRSKNKDWLAQNQDNVSECSDLSTRKLLFQWPSTIKIHLGVFVWYKWTSLSSHQNVTFFTKIWLKYCSLGVKQQSLTHSNLLSS